MVVGMFEFLSTENNEIQMVRMDLQFLCFLQECSGLGLCCMIVGRI